MASVLGRRRRDEDGAAAVEFAIVLIPLMLILFGIISYAYMFSVRQALTQAAAEGARAAAVAPSNPGDAAASAVTKALSGFGGLNCGERGLECPPPSIADCQGGTAQCATVTVKLDYNTYDPFDLPFIPMPDILQFTSSAEVN